MKTPNLTKIDISLVNRDTELWVVTIIEENDKVYKQKNYKTREEAMAFIGGIQFGYNILTGNVLPVTQNFY